MKLDDATSTECQWRHALIQPAFAAPKRSTERARIIKDIASREHVNPKGRRERVSETSVQRWVRAFEENGFAGLVRKKRSDHGEAAVIVTRAWDRAVPFDDLNKASIRDKLRDYIRSLRKRGESQSYVEFLAAAKLLELTQEAGFLGDYDTLKAVCEVPYHLIQRERVYKKVNTFKNDRSTYENAKPRIQRTRAGLSPNDIWVGDVHPVDIAYRREDGSTAHLRAVAWLDLATNRVHATWFALEKGQGSIRNTHVIRSFVSAVTAWGVPRALYLDNGAEYNFAEFINDALKLLDMQNRRLIGDIAPWAEHHSNIIRAMPYNAPAKPIENIFGVLESKHFSPIPGWIGGDRMRKRTQNHGRAPDPFPGTVEDLCKLLDNALATYNALPQVGRALNNLSPNDALRKAIEGGWKPTIINSDALRVAFSTEETRQVRQGAIRHKGLLWTSRDLQAYQGDTVTVLIPKYEDWLRLPVRDENGQIFTFVEEDKPFGILDPAGAREADARSREHRKGVAALDRSVPNIDRLAEREKLAQHLRGPPALPAPAARITSSTEADHVAGNVGLSQDAEDERKRRQLAAQQREEAEATARRAKLRATAAKMQANRAARNGGSS